MNRVVSPGADFELRLPRPAAARCRIRVGRDARAELVRDLAAKPLGSPLVIISDSRVAALYGRPLRRALAKKGLVAHVVTFPAGERHKSRRTKERIEDELRRLGVGRDAAVLAVGGGVTGDLAGFVAATWLRGIPVVQVPTTLLAMVDAAVGGKTAVNLPAGKNLVGSFHHPRALYADVGVLSTLPDERFREGLAEVVKAAAIADRSFFGWLEREADSVLARDPATVEALVRRTIEIKGRIVRQDPHEAGRRALLNFGHTVAHALESVSGYRMSHGAAVARGLCVEARLACELTGFPDEHVERMERLLERWSLPTRVPRRFVGTAIVRATRSDKKVRRGRVRFALPLQLGKGLAGADVTVEASESQLERALAATR